MDATQIIRALGGATKISSQIGSSRSAVSNWPRHGIPARFWPALARLAAENEDTRHITLEVIEAARGAAPAPAPAKVA
jgi:hypothetical protein